MKTLIAVFQLPIVLLNSLGFIISAIWLLVIGQWGSVVAGIVIAMVAPTLLAFAVLPGVLLAGPAVYFGNKGLTIGVYFFGFLASIFIYVLITTWCGGVTFYFLRDIPSNAFWPALIWSYGVATSPWSYMAQRDQSPTAFLAAFFAQIGFVVAISFVALGGAIHDGFQVFSLVMMVGVVFHMRLLAEAYRTSSPD